MVVVTTRKPIVGEGDEIYADVPGLRCEGKWIKWYRKVTSPLRETSRSLNWFFLKKSEKLN